MLSPLAAGTTRGGAPGVGGGRRVLHDVAARRGNQRTLQKELPAIRGHLVLGTRRTGNKTSPCEQAPNPFGKPADDLGDIGVLGHTGPLELHPSVRPLVEDAFWHEGVAMGKKLDAIKRP